MIYTLDIETKGRKELVNLFAGNVKVGNLKDPEKIAAKMKEARDNALSKMACSRHYSDIAMVGIKELGKAPYVTDLKGLSDLMESDREARFVTYNGKSFDIPIIINNAIKNVVPFDFDILMGMTRRYRNDRHIDLMEVLNEYGNYESLDNLLQIYLGISKTPIDFDTCSDEELEAHCKEDLVNTEALYLLFEPICKFGG